MVVVVVQVVEGAATVDVAIENNKKKKTKKKKKTAHALGVSITALWVCASHLKILSHQEQPPEKRVRWVEQKGKSDEEKMR